MKKAIVTGAGLSGLSASAYLAKKGFEVDLFEKHEIPGGKARIFSAEGFTFNMGPSWYWFPEIIEKFYNDFGLSSVDFYSLKKLDPGYRIYFDNDLFIDIPADKDALNDVFETVEKNSSRKLDKFLKNASQAYNLITNRLIYKAETGISGWFDWDILAVLLKFKLHGSLAHYARSLFKDERLIRIIEFPLAFLGAFPDKIGSIYNIVNYGCLKFGTWYPQGGMYKIVDAWVKIINDLGVSIHYSNEVEDFEVINKIVTGIFTNKKSLHADYFVSAAEYHHTEQLLSREFRNFTEKYWRNSVISPSALLFFIGINTKVKNLIHHNVFINSDFEIYMEDTHVNWKWPEAPSFYVTCISKTDASSAPEGMENLVALIPVASGLEDSGKIRDHYFSYIIQNLEKITGQIIMDKIVYKRSYAQTNFISDYNAFQGNAFSFANTFSHYSKLNKLLRNKYLTNLYYTGHTSLQGFGIPMALLSGKLVTGKVEADYNKLHS
ncbi:MAG: phytoene desaturase [Bacteroidales bacterium]|nr:phytoene desaturase [Bacteroidales bacterium]